MCMCVCVCVCVCFTVAIHANNESIDCTWMSHSLQVNSAIVGSSKQCIPVVCMYHTPSWTVVPCSEEAAVVLLN